MSMQLPYTGLLADDLANLGFPQGMVTDDNNDTGRWYIRTYRAGGVEVEVDEENGTVTVARLRDNASDATGWPQLWAIPFSIAAIEHDPETVVATIRAIHTKRRLSDTGRPMPARSAA